MDFTYAVLVTGERVWMIETEWDTESEANERAQVLVSRGLPASHVMVIPKEK